MTHPSTYPRYNFSRYSGEAKFKESLNTEDIQKIRDYLSNLKTSYGYVPEYLIQDVVSDPTDSSQWNSPVGWDENTDQYGYIPANQLMGSVPASETEFEDWLSTRYGKPNPNALASDMHDIFGTDRDETFRPHEREMKIMAPYLPHLASKEGGYNTELDLGGVWPNRRFFPEKRYPEVQLDALQKFIESGEEIGMDIPPGSAGVYRGEEWGEGLWDLDIGKEYWDDLPTTSQIAGHEVGHLATESDLYPNFWGNAPHPFSYAKKGGQLYSILKDINPNMGTGSEHFASEHRFHPEIHSIDEQFFGGYNQPRISSNLVRKGTPISKEQVENVNYMMNRTVQDERNALSNYTSPPRGTERFNTGGLASLVPGGKR